MWNSDDSLGEVVKSPLVLTRGREGTGKVQERWGREGEISSIPWQDD